ncbi:hypothetical protein Enr10x_15100 [Gimesia panareensis]|uniref:Uncharacterized protein n=1 Tax=Gimesia panareensis TaxID=2527978 RepID=A0A517Q3L0_9PLAN|nr:hypothetical protein Enr10x_15100 [Gimesia panareensis]
MKFRGTGQKIFLTVENGNGKLITEIISVLISFLFDWSN